MPRLSVAIGLLGQIRVLMGGLIVGLLIIFLCLLLRGSEKGLPLAGVLLQLAGIVSVVWGLTSLFPLFGKPSIIQSAVQWFCGWRYVVVKMPPISGRGAMTESADRMRGYGYVGFSRQGSFEERLKVVEDYTENLAKNISQVHAMLDKVADNVEETLMRESRERERADIEIQARLERSFMDGIQLQFVGAAYVFFGTILSSLSVFTSS